MSSRFLLKITLTSALVLAHLVFPSLVSGMEERSISHYLSGKCSPTHRHDKFFPLTKCSEYLECDSEGRAFRKVCNETDPGTTIFNITSKQCVKDTTPACQDEFKVNVTEWHGLDEKSIAILSDGKELQMPATKKDLKRNFDDVEKSYNSAFNVLLKTSFLAVEDGFHTFSSDCIPWCKIWIKKDICGTSELVLHQKERTQNAYKVEYHVQNNYTMKFGTFYYLIVVHIGKTGKNSKFQIGVKWPDEPAMSVIPSALLRLPAKKKCPKQSSINVSPTTTISHFVRPSPNRTVSLSNTLPLTGILSRTRSSILIGTSTGSSILTGTSTVVGSSSPSETPTTTRLLAPSSVTQTSVRTKFTPTRKYTTPSSSTTPPGFTTPSSKSSFQVFVKRVNANLSSPNNQTNDSSTQDGNGLTLARLVDVHGERIAENWNQSGKSMTVWDRNVVMEVNFPLSNYTFPRQNILNNTIGKDFQSDQIYIPLKTLVTETGEFKRKVFSALYFNLKNKIPQSFNVVETETNQIRGLYQLNSHVIASTAVPRISGLQNYDIVIRLAHLNTNFSRENKPLCVFLKWKNDVNSDGVWSTEGCIRDENLSNENISVCRCNHLTHFGVLMQVDTHKLSSTDLKALKFISYIGCALSLIGAFLTVLAIMCLPGARSDRNFIHVNLAVAIGLAQVTFLAGIDEVGHEVICTIVAAFLHYFLLVAFSWMLIEGIFLHILIVKVFHDHLPKKRFYVTFCWGLPLLIVLVSVNLLRDGYGTKTSCWLSTDKSTIWTFSGPAILVMMINIIILCKVMKEINSLKTSDRRDSNVRSVRYGVRSTIILLPLLGLTWAFGLICVNDSLVVFQYLFTIFNSLQGLFIFLFHCVFNSEVRKAFWRKVDIWFTNHNRPFGNNGHSRSSFKKSNNDPSSVSSPDKDKPAPPRNGLSMYSFDDFTERERRKFSTATASTCLDSWPHKLSLTPSMDGPYPSRFTPSLSSDDIKYQPIYKQDAGQKMTPPKTLQIRVEDLNGNTRNLDCDSGLQKDGVNSVQNNETGRNLAQNGHAERSSVDVKEKQANTNSQQQKIPQNSGKNIENPKSSEGNFIQKQPQQNYNEQNSLNNSQQRPRPTKKSSRESLDDEQTVGIGGQPMNSGDPTGHIRMIDVNSSTRSFGTKL